MVPQNSGKDELLEKKERILHCFNQSKGTGFFIFSRCKTTRGVLIKVKGGVIWEEDFQKIRRSGGESSRWYNNVEN